MKPNLYTALLGIAFLFVGCGEDLLEEAADGIQPGSGVTIAGEALELTATRSTTEERFGAIENVRDVGSTGVWFELPNAPICGTFTGSETTDTVAILHLGQGFSGTTEGGLTIGSDKAAVQAAFGEPELDPFLSLWWYRTHGIAFELEGDVVARIHVFNPTP